MGSENIKVHVGPNNIPNTTVYIVMIKEEDLDRQQPLITHDKRLMSGTDCELWLA